LAHTYEYSRYKGVSNKKTRSKLFSQSKINRKTIKSIIFYFTVSTIFIVNIEESVPAIKESKEFESVFNNVPSRKTTINQIKDEKTATVATAEIIATTTTAATTDAEPNPSTAR
jgi:hypothetical protein